ncbi:hypothetical protein Psi01_29160 [Planobispora siamensis]|uniref:Uncharacterized protein n=1 Tax=Planobispora siamensis TaxID=936338 RepID=A0A8J3SGS7_9ACTN|nr:hypothetical protein Psi01_29160 [Planobispora siamensis]
MWKDHAAANDPDISRIIPETKAGTAQPGMGHMVIPVTPATSRAAPPAETPRPILFIGPIEVLQSHVYVVSS